MPFTFVYKSHIFCNLGKSHVYIVESGTIAVSLQSGVNCENDLETPVNPRFEIILGVESAHVYACLHTNPCRNMKMAIYHHHTALGSGLAICKLKEVADAFYDTKCPYQDQASFNNNQLTIP